MLPLTRFSGPGTVVVCERTLVGGKGKGALDNCHARPLRVLRRRYKGASVELDKRGPYAVTYVVSSLSPRKIEVYKRKQTTERGSFNK